MRLFLLPFLVTALVTPLTAATIQKEAPDTSWATAGLSTPQSGVYHDDHGSDLWSRGPDYKANFAPDGVQYIPFLGSEADRLHPLAWSLARVWQGDTELGSKSNVLPVRENESVLYKHKSWTEGYSVREQGIEQWYRFEELPTTGDLLISMELKSETEFQVEPWKGGLRFLGERGGVDYGAAKAFDGEGRSIPAHVEWTGEAIQIRVYGSNLDGAVLPITVDPLITTYTVDDFGTYLFKPDVAYDLTTNSILVVYEEVFAGPDTDIFFRQFDADTRVLLRQGYLTINTDSWTVPRVANNNFADLFLVVFEIEGAGVSNVSYRTISALDGSLSQIWGVSSTEFVSNYQPDVGGETVDIAGSYFLIVWVEDNLQGSTQIVSTRVGSDGMALFDYTVLAPTDSWVKKNPAVSNAASTVGVFNLAWAADEGPGTTVRGARIQWNGTVLDTGYFIGATAAIPFCLATVSPPLETGDVGKYLVLYETRVPTAPSTFAAGLNAVLMDGSVVVDSMLVDPNFRYEQSSHARVDSDGNQFVLGFNTLDEATDYQFKVHLSAMSSSLGKLCHSDIRVPIDHINLITDGLPTVVTEKSGGGVGHGIHMAWARDLDNNMDWNIQGAEYELSNPDCLGQVQLCAPTDNSSGQGGRTWAYGSYVATDRDFVLMADQLPLNQIGYFLAGTGIGGFVPPGSQGELCLAGNLGRFNRGLSEVRTSGANGEFSVIIDTLDMPLASAPIVTSGSTWFFQAWHRDLNPSQTSNFTTLLGVNFD